MSSTPLERGLWVVLATPFDEDDEVDHHSLRRQVELAERVGATGLVALGVFGEAASLSSAEQGSVLHTVSAATDLPVVAGLSARTTAVAVEQAHQCIAAGSRPPACRDGAGPLAPERGARRPPAADQRRDRTRRGAAGLPGRLRGARHRRRPARDGHALPVRGRHQGRVHAYRTLGGRPDRGHPPAGLRRPGRRRPGRRAGLRRRRCDDRFQPPGGPARRPHGVRRGRLRRGPRGLGAVAAAGKLRGPGRHRARPSQGDPAAARGADDASRAAAGPRRTAAPRAGARPSTCPRSPPPWRCS